MDHIMDSAEIVAKLTQRISRNASQASARNAAIDERKAQDTKSTTDDKITESITLVEGTTDSSMVSNFDYIAS
ncbi:hypothetical protein FF1_026986 [Malus domestica]